MDNFDILDKTIKEKVDKIIGNYLSAKDTQITNLENDSEGYSNICAIKISKKFKLKETSKKKTLKNCEKHSEKILLGKKSEKRLFYRPKEIDRKSVV